MTGLPPSTLREMTMRELEAVTRWIARKNQG